MQEYLHTVKSLVDEIFLIDHLISKDDLMLYILNGLGSDFREIVAPFKQENGRFILRNSMISSLTMMHTCTTWKPPHSSWLQWQITPIIIMRLLLEAITSRASIKPMGHTATMILLWAHLVAQLVQGITKKNKIWWVTVILTQMSTLWSSGPHWKKLYACAIFSCYSELHSTTPAMTING